MMVILFPTRMWSTPQVNSMKAFSSTIQPNTLLIINASLASHASFPGLVLMRTLKDPSQPH